MLQGRKPLSTFVLVSLIVLMSASLVPGAGASTPSADRTFTVQVPWQNLRLETVTEGDKVYTRVSLPGWSSTSVAGTPQLPFRVRTVGGVPFGAAVSVQVTPGPAHTVALPAPVVPMVTQVAEWGLPGPGGDIALPVPSFELREDPAVYAGQAAYPGTLARVSGDAMLGQQRVAGVVVYPVQYDPATQELVVYESLTVTVTFQDPSSATAQAAEPYSKLVEGEPALAQSLELAPPTAGSNPWAPPVPGWPVKVREDGMYKLTYAELDGAGLPVGTSLATSTFQLYNLGSEVAIHIDDIDADGVFDAEDSLLFYGQAVESKYTWDNVYWLTYGQGPGLRMAARDGTPGAGASPLYHVTTVHREENVTYRSANPGDENLERFLWNYSYPPSKPSSYYTVALAAPYEGDYTASLTVAMLGALSYAINPDHHTQVKVNGTVVDDAWWDGLVWRVAEIQVPQSLLIVGDNTVELFLPNDTGAGVDAVYVDWVELDYANTFVAQGEELAFGSVDPGTWLFEVEGFSTDLVPVDVYDVTDPAAVGRIENVVLGYDNKAKSYVASFEDTLASPTDYWALADTAYHTVQAIEADTASNLASMANGADHITITHADFASQAQRLADYRATQNLRAVVVDVQDVYDEFGYGIVGAAPIRDFLAYAYANWQAPAPSYVVLFGDGHYDPKNYLGYGRTSYIPPYLAPVDPWLGETAADNRYVTVSGDDNMPDMMLGRLAVNSLAEATAFVDKIIAYEQSPVPGDWQTQVLAVADNADGGGNFDNLSDGVLDCCVPDGYTEEKVYYGVTHTTVTDAKTAIVDGINAGKLFVNYIGHAGINAWAGEGLFRASDVAGLTNTGKLAIMLPMTCYDGYYFHPNAGASSTAEVITRADGKGAVASWSPTGLGVATGHDSLNRGFLEAALVDRVSTIGEATQAGKLELWATGSNLDLLDTYLLFGDPATRLPEAPTAVGLLSFTATGAQNAIVLNWETATELNNLGFNLYRAESLDGGQTKINAELIPTLVPPGTILGAQYEYVDGDVVAGITYHYWLETVDIYSGTGRHGPVEAQAPVPAMRVADLDGVKSNENKKFWWAGVTTLIVDENGSPVADATVTGDWSGGTSGTSSCLTDSAGLCMMTSDKVSLTQPSVTLTVTGVSHGSLVYDAGQNGDPDGDSDGTTIVIYRDGPAPNQPPIPSFTYTCADSVCTFDGNGSSDPDGTIVSYDWDFGNGSTGAGVETTHEYGQAGSYTVVLTVTDDGGGSGSESQSVAVGDVPPGETYVYDISMSGAAKGPNRSATAVVTIVDTAGSPVEGAAVYGDWSGDDSASVQGITGADGTVLLTSGKVRKENATFTFAVSNVIKDGSTYNPALNVETSDSITVP